MEVNGMKRNKQENIKPKIKVNLNILQFGSLKYKIVGFPQSIEGVKKGELTYIEPLTTNIEKVEISYEEGGTYSVPKTTNGM